MRLRTAAFLVFLSSMSLGFSAFERAPAAQVLPDLVIRISNVPNPGSLRRQTNFRFNIYVKNSGTVKTEECIEVRGEFPILYFTISTVSDPFTGGACRPCAFNGAGVRDGYTGFTCTLKGLAPQQENGFSVALYTQMVGATTITATADPDNRIRETNEKNTATAAVVVTR